MLAKIRDANDVTLPDAERPQPVATNARERPAEHDSSAHPFTRPTSGQELRGVGERDDEVVIQPREEDVTRRGRRSAQASPPIAPLARAHSINAARVQAQR